MTASIDFSDGDNYDLKSNAIWDILYQFIRSLVWRWVRSSHIPLWHGQEEDVAADIVQETMIRTFKYALTFSLREEETVSCNSLKIICESIAYTQYQHLSYQDSRFVHMRSRKYPYWRYIIIGEQLDQLEIGTDHIQQERCCEHLANEIAEIPTGPRTALLTHLANLICFDAQISHLLQNAFLKRGIQLQSYQRLSPNSPSAHSKHKNLLQSAYNRVIKKQEKLNKLENSETIYVNQEPTPASHEQPPDHILDNSALIAELDTTAPYAMVDPDFRQRLQNKLLDIQAEYHIPVVSVSPAFQEALRDKFIDHPPIHTFGEEINLPPSDAPKGIIEASNKKINADQMQSSVPGYSDSDNLGTDPGLTILRACLRTNAAFID